MLPDKAFPSNPHQRELVLRRVLDCGYLDSTGRASAKWLARERWRRALLWVRNHERLWRFAIEVNERSLAPGGKGALRAASNWRGMLALSDEMRDAEFLPRGCEPDPAAVARVYRMSVPSSARPCWLGEVLHAVCAEVVSLSAIFRPLCAKRLFCSKLL